MNATRAFLLLAVCLGFAACGGGGGGGGGQGVLGIQDAAVQPLSPDYRATFSVTGTATASSAPVSIPLTGSLTLENEGVQVVYPVEVSRTGWRVKTTLVLDVPLIVRTQYPQLPAQITVAYTEFIEMAADGSWTSLGAETTDTVSGGGGTYRTWASAPLLLRRPQLLAGQVIDNPTTDMLSDDLSTVAGTRRLVRTVAPSTTTLVTPLGAMECLVVDEVETLSGGSVPATPVSYRRWERPDYGVLRLEIDTFTYAGTFDGQPTTLTVRDVVAALESLRR